MPRNTWVIFPLIVLIFSGCRPDSLTLNIRFDRVYGLQRGDPVLYNRNLIGKVTDVIQSDNGSYLAAVKIKKEFMDAATEYSRFSIIDDPDHQGRQAVEMVQVRKGGSLLKNHAVVAGSSRTAVLFDTMISNVEEGFEQLRQQFDQAVKDLSKVPESDAFKKLEDELKRLSDEIDQSGKAARKKIEQEILPRLKQELEELKERLHKMGREDELKPLEIELQKIKNDL